MKTDLYSIEVPEGWEVSQEENLTSLYKQNNGVGALQISVYVVPDDYELNLFDELFDFTSNYIEEENVYKEYNKVSKIENGLILNDILENNKKWIFALINKDRKIVFATYNASIEDFGVENEEISKIIKSIIPN